MAIAKKTDKVQVPLEPQEPVTPEPAPEPSEPTYTPPEKYKDKKLEDIIKMHEEAEKKIGSMGEEIGKERREREKAQTDLNYLSTWYQNQQAKSQEQQPQPGTPTIDYDDLGGSVDRIVENRLKSWANEQKKQQQKQQYYDATQSYHRGRAGALKSNPDLYDGIEQRVATAVWNAYASGLISQWNLSDAETWENAAWLVHKQDKNWDKLVPPKVKPVSPTPTETPTGVKPGLPPEEKPIHFRDDSKELIRGLGQGKFTEKEVAEMVKKERKERAEREE